MSAAKPEALQFQPDGSLTAWEILVLEQELQLDRHKGGMWIWKNLYEILQGYVKFVWSGLPWVESEARASMILLLFGEM